MIKGLYRLHRAEYLARTHTKEDTEACPFCVERDYLLQEKQEEDDNLSLSVFKGKYTFICLNKYPYNYGHLLICPFRHVDKITELTQEERYEMSDLSISAINAINTLSSPEAYNIGYNQGEFSGAGIPKHLHEHVIPRWRGDTSFINLIADIKILPDLLLDTKKKLQLILNR
jgi:ATP adenylyltransferase